MQNIKQMFKIFKKETVFIFSIVFLSFILYTLYAYLRGGLIGDEFHTIRLVKTPFRIFNAFLYFLLLHFWMIFFSDNDFWLRFFSVIFAILNVPMFYLLGRKFIGDKRGARILTLLNTFSPFLVYYATYVRFYSFFPFFSLCSFFFFWLWVKQKRILYIFCLFLCNVLLILSHLFGILVVFIEILYIWIMHKKQKLLKRLVICIFTTAVLAILLACSPALLRFGYEMFQKMIQPLSYYSFSQSRGFKLLQIIKIFWIFSCFILGFFVYPLNIFVFVYILFIAILCLIAFNSVRRKPQEAMFFFLLLVYLPCVVFLIFDSLVPLGGGVGAHHLIFLVPIFYLFLVTGLSKLSSKKFYLLSLPLVVTNIIFTFLTIKPIESFYTLESPDYRKIYQSVLKSNFKPQIIICDGRAFEPLKRYFKFNIPVVIMDSFITKDEPLSYSKILFVTADWRKYKIKKANSFLSTLQQFSYRLLYYQFPVFVFYLEKQQDTLSFNKNIVPLNIWTIEFRNLALPLSVFFDKKQFTIGHIFTLYSDNRDCTIILQQPLSIKGVNIFSNITGLPPLSNEIVAELHFFLNNNLVHTIPLVYRIDTDYWLSKKQSVPVVYQWHKKIAFLGSSTYRGAWKDTKAHIYGKYVKLPSEIKVDRIEAVLKNDKYEFNLFGLFLDAE